MSSYFKQALNQAYNNSPHNPPSMYPTQAQPPKKSMIQRFKSSIQMFIPSSIRDQVFAFLDLLEITLQIDKQNEDSNNSATIEQIKMLLNDISQYITNKVNELQLTGMVKNFFQNLAAFIVLFAYLFGAGGAFNRKGNVIYHGDGGLKAKRTNRRRKHKKTRR